MPTGWGSSAGGEDRPRDLPRAPSQYHVPATARHGAPPASSAPAETPAPPRRPAPQARPRRRRVGPWKVVGIGLGALAVLVLFGLLFAVWQFQRMDRVEVAHVLSPAGGGGTNYLIVGSDGREGFDPNDPTAGAVLGDGTADDPTERSDTILVLRTTGDGAVMMSIPRDLWVTRPDGSEGRINAAYRQGPAALVQTVQGLGIPVHHYLEVDFVTFAGMVDGVGGVPIELPHPARDLASGLDQPEAGMVTLDGSQALAFVRSRQYAELVDGSWRTDPTGDLGRVQRQQAFLRSVMSEVGSTRNPIELIRVSNSVAGGLRIDDRMGFFDALGLARRLRGLEPESVELPVYGFSAGGASVLGLIQPDAEAALARFR